MNPRRVQPRVPRAPVYPARDKAMNMPNRTVRPKRKCVSCGRWIGTYKGRDLYKHRRASPFFTWCTSRTGKVIQKGN